MNWEVMLSIIISVLALGLSVFTYFRHDAKIKQQEKQINEFQLLKLKKEIEVDRQAIINANVIRKDGRRRIVKIYNRGKSIAKNVNAIIKEDNNRYRVTENPSPIDIIPQGSVEIRVTSFKDRANKLEIEIQWEDGFKNDNIVQQTLQI